MNTRCTIYNTIPVKLFNLGQYKDLDKFYYYIPDLEKFLDIDLKKFTTSDSSTFEDNTVRIGAANIPIKDTSIDKFTTCYTCVPSVAFLTFLVKKKSVDEEELKQEVKRLRELVMFDSNSFAEFIEAHCPILSSFVDEDTERDNLIGKLRDLVS